MASALLLSACTGSEGRAPGTTTPNAEGATEGATESTADIAVTPTAEVVESAQPTSAPESSAQVSDADRIAAARTVLETEFGAGFQAFDILDETVQGQVVEFTISAWEGDDIYDEVIELRYDTVPNDAGELQPALLTSQSRSQECLNTDLVQSAFAFIDEHDEYWTSVLENPTTFDPAVRAPEIFTPGMGELVSELAAGWVDDGVHWQQQNYRGDLATTSAFPPVWRRYDGRNGPLLAVAACRTMQDGFGLFRDDLLLEDFTTSLDVVADYSILEYLLIRQDGEWRIDGVNTLVWANCLGAGTWVESANSWKPEPVPWQEFTERF